MLDVADAVVDIRFSAATIRHYVIIFSLFDAITPPLRHTPHFFRLLLTS